MKTTVQLFGENLRNQLYLKGKSQADISRHLKVSETSVSRWVNGLAMPRAKMIDALCKFLNCTMEDLTVDHSKPIEIEPADIISETIQENPKLFKLMLKAMKLSDAELDKLIEGIR